MAVELITFAVVCLALPKLHSFQEAHKNTFTSLYTPEVQLKKAFETGGGPRKVFKKTKLVLNTLMLNYLILDHSNTIV